MRILTIIGSLRNSFSPKSASARGGPHWLLDSSAIARIFLGSSLLIVAARVMIALIPGYFDLSRDYYFLSDSVPRAEHYNYYSYHDFMLNHGELLNSIFTWRPPLLVFFGIFTPLIVFVSRANNANMAAVLTPYFLLIAAQAGTSFLASLILANGALTFADLVYSILRVMQVNAIYKTTTLMCDRIRLPRQQRFIRLSSVCSLLVLWALNSIYLLLFIAFVTVGLFQLGLIWRYK